MNDVVRPGRGALAAWVFLVAALSALNYGARAAGGDPPRDAVYRYSFAVNGIVLFAIVLGAVLLISRGYPKRELLALRRPTSWRRAALIGLGVFLTVFVLGALLEPFLHAGREQGIAPTRWDGSRAMAFAASFAVIALVAPITEELTFRGLGFAVLERLGRHAAILLVGLAFGLVHGLVAGLPILIAFGAGLAYLRSRTESVYPPMLLHGGYNALALTASVAV